MNINDLMRKLLALPEQASTVARDIDDLHYFVITVTMIGATIVGLTALYFVVKYRRRSEDDLTPRVKVPGFLEFTWIVGLLALFIFWWVLGFQRYVALQVPPDDSVEVYVMGKQWMWKFSYPDGRSSVNVLTVPAGRPVKLNMTSRDVIHSFYVPDFRVKQDVIPGRYTTLWFEAVKPGNYQILCAEYCGTSHSRMVGEIVALSPSDYERWLEAASAPMVAATEPGTPVRVQQGEPLPPDDTQRRVSQVGFQAGPARDMASRGREFAVKHGCFNCHTVDGRRHIGPTWQGLFGREIKLQEGETIIADASYLTESMMDPTAKVVAGFVPVMPTYQGLLPAPEAAAILEYIKSLRPGIESASPALPETNVPLAVPGEITGAAAPGPVPEGDDRAGAGLQLAQQYGCISCHTVDGRQHIGPTWAGVYGGEVRLQDGQTVRVDDAYLRESILDPRAKIVAGYNPVMPTYDQLLEPGQVDLLVDYIKSLAAESDRP